MSDTMRAVLWMGGAILALSSMAVSGRYVTLEHDTFELMLYRSLVGLVVVLIVSRLTGTYRSINPNKFGWHIARNIAHFSGQNLWFFAISLIPLAQVVSLEFTGPLWALMLAPLVLGEEITRSRVLAALVGFVGILIVTRPFSEPLTPGVISAALAAIGFAGSAIFTRRLTRTESITSILFWMTAMQAVFGLVCAGADGHIKMIAPAAVIWVILIGLAGLAAHFCLTSALRLAPATLVMPVDFARLPVLALVGWLLYQEHLDPMVIAGGVLIIGANWANLHAEGRRSRLAQETGRLA
ncbi:MAG: DMT family transporter [Maritimibacter sp.]